MKKFDYNDINLIPRYSTVDSRSECDTTIKFGKHTFRNPVIPANMESVINEELAVDLAKNGYFYIMHRFDIDSVEFTLKMKNMGLISSISIGVNEESYQTVDRFVELAIAPDYVCIDIAHGHSKKLKHMIKYLREKLPESFIIAGNVSTREAVEDLTEWGAGAVKVGIGPGCFIPEAPIKTISGIKILKDIIVGDLVLTHTNTYKEVLQVHEYDNKDELISINDLPPCSPSHEFYVINKDDKSLVTEDNLHDYAKWVKAEDLTHEYLLIKM